jgi:hypothetical protein
LANLLVESSAVDTVKNWTEEAGVSFHMSSLSADYNNTKVIGNFNEGQSNMSFGQCASTLEESKPFVRVDLGQSRLIKSVFILVGYDSSDKTYNIS